MAVGLLVLYYLISAINACRGWESPFLTLFSLFLFGLAMGCFILDNSLQIWTRRPGNWLIFVFFTSAIFGQSVYSVVASRAESLHKKRAHQYNLRHQYAQALPEYRWLGERRWYRLFGNGDALSPILISLAETARQVGEYDLAKRSYVRLMAHEKDEYWRRRADEELQRLQQGLRVLDLYERWLHGESRALDKVPDRFLSEPPDPTIVIPDPMLSEPTDPKMREVDALYRVARILKYDLGSRARAKEVYNKILSTDVPDMTKQWAEKYLAEMKKDDDRARSR